MPKAQRTVTVGSSVGLHARPASTFVQAVAATGHNVTITKSNGDDADGASILSVLALAVGHGEEIVLDVEGDNAEAIADELASLLTSDLDAD
ncbi:HPr family phosphocarrier protein [Aurantimicrobium minutum]|uniref:HPr family phosphocarrier protein n=1 Tax=Aurantimicrobium minutum TaxID=708131 RepID=UPI00248F156D|nr:HPr family phosphocarrier protein [Aurantimicrobium minutum]